MTRPGGSEVQQAIAFLSTADLTNVDGPLPARPDYESIARHAASLGHDLSPGAVRQAFQHIMRARLVASQRPGA